MNRGIHYIDNKMGHSTGGTVRPMIEFIYGAGKENLVGAEIGCAKGFNALYMLSHLSLKRLYLIDPHIEHAMDLLKGFDDVIVPIQMLSVDAVNDIPMLDFCYIDADHSYESAKSDIESYYPKMKQGGVLGGHDFDIGHPGVIRAVGEFVEEKKVEKRFNLFADWWVIKLLNQG